MRGAGGVGGTVSPVNKCLLGTYYVTRMKLGAGLNTRHMAPALLKPVISYCLAGETMGTEKEGANGSTHGQERGGTLGSQAEQDSTQSRTWQGMC